MRDRETADHSIPYLVAVALIDGEVTARQFTDERIADPVAQELMTRITVREDPAMTARFPAAQAARIEANADGKLYAAYIDNSRGNAANPLSDAEIEAKFRSLADGVLPARRVDRLLAALWAFDEQPRASDAAP